MRFSDYPFLKYVSLLIGGIIFGQEVDFLDVYVVAVWIGALWLAYFIYLKIKRTKSKLVNLALVGYLLVFSFGVFLIVLEKEAEPPHVDLESLEGYIAEVRQFDLEKPNSFENLLEIRAVRDSGEWKLATGKVLVYHQSQSPFFPGQILKITNRPERIAGPKNPYEFDYREFLARKGIYFRQFVGKDFNVIDSTAGKSADFFLINLRNQLARQINNKLPDEQSKQIAMALLLGQKQTLDRDLRDGYVQAGVMHILAVSGLHVGIVYALLIGLLKPLKLTKKWARSYLMLVVSLIWVYAIITGLSPSVVRAATMFSLIALGQLRERKPSVFNILAFSAMLMIVVDPEVIYEVGFQLSYLAVAGIVLIQPLILNWWLPTNRILEYFWQLTAVSLAAQLATFPLSVYYFHVFPTYFLLGNLLILPLAFLIMQVGVPFLFISWIPVLGDVFGWALSKLIWLQNEIVLIIQELPLGKLDRLTISPSSMMICWIFLLIWAGWLLGKKKQLIYWCFLSIVIWSGVMLVEEINRPSQELIIYQGIKGQVIDYRVGNQFFAWNAGVEQEALTYMVEPNRIQMNLGVIPLPIFGIPVSENQLQLFPSPVFFSPNNSKIFFGIHQPKHVSIWSDGRWEGDQIKDTLELGEMAFRIVF